MANYSAAVLLLLLSAAVSSSLAVDSSDSAATTFLELESMLESVRSHGRTLFTNAVATSDLHYRLLNRSSSEPPPYTLFAPTDEALFALDMASDAAAYVATLHYHVVPGRRLAFADLRNLSSSSPPFLGTLLHHYSVLVGTTRGLANNDSAAVVGVMVDGVRVSRPDLFLGPRIAVHGIDGILLTGLNMMNQYLDGGENGSGIVLPPAESPVSRSGFVWGVNAPAPAMAAEGNVRVAAPSVMLMDGAERVKVVGGKKKAGKRHRDGHSHHRRHRKVSGNHHHFDDL